MAKPLDAEDPLRFWVGFGWAMVISLLLWLPIIWGCSVAL
jgi:hypothetical protein